MAECAGPEFDIGDYGAIGDHQTIDTVAIQRAIAACSAAGGANRNVTPGAALNIALLKRTR